MSCVASSLRAATLTACAVVAGCASRANPVQDARAWPASPGVLETQASDRAAGVSSRPDSAEPYGGDQERDPHRFRRALGWISLAVGAEAAVVAVTTSVMLLHQKSVVDNDCDAKNRCSAAGLDATASIHETVPWNTGSWVMAAAGLSAATVLLITSQPEPGHAAMRVSPEQGGASLGLTGSF